MRVTLFGHSVLIPGYTEEWRLIRELAVDERNRLEREYTSMVRDCAAHTPHARQAVFERWQRTMHIVKTLDSVTSD